MQQNRINLDWVRGLAALLVCALHCREITWVGMREFMRARDSQSPIDIALACLGAPIVWGSIGVPIFFVLSGYVIHAAQASRIQRDPTWRLDVKRFYQRRFVRVYAVLIGALALTFVLDHVTQVFAPWHPKLGDLSLTTLDGNLLSLQASLVHPYGSDAPLWTLAFEIHFYALYPLLLIARRRFSPELLLAGSAIVTLAGYFLLPRAGLLEFTTYYFCWVLGFHAAELQASGRLPLGRKAIAACGVAVTAIGCAVFFKSQYGSFIIWSMGFYLFLLNLLSRPIAEGKAIRALSRVGTFSYTLYAIHEPVIVSLVAVFATGAKSYSMAVVGLYFFATIGVGAVFYRLFERPSIRWLAGPSHEGRSRPIADNRREVARFLR